MLDPLTPTTETSTPSAELDVRGLFLRFLAGGALFAFVLMAIGWLLQEEVLAVSRRFIELLGGPGVALGFFLPDGLCLPLPPDAFLAFGLMGGLGFWPIVFWASLGSIVGGVLGWSIGRGLAHTGPFKRFMDRRGAEAHVLLKRYGLVALALGALTPLPYSIMCWACGAIGMRLGPFVAVSLLRVPRIVFYLWLMKLGVATVFG